MFINLKTAVRSVPLLRQHALIPTGQQTKILTSQGYESYLADQKGRGSSFAFFVSCLLTLREDFGENISSHIFWDFSYLQSILPRPSEESFRAPFRRLAGRSHSSDCGKEEVPRRNCVLLE